jgi:hypothetical protein
MMPKEYGLEVYNIFSEKDRVTGWAAQKKDKFTYNVKILKCDSPGSALTLWLTEHYFMGPTYQKGVRDKLNDIRYDIGFYDGNTR